MLGDDAFDRPHSYEELVYAFAILTALFIAICQFLTWMVETEMEFMEL